MVLPEIEEEYEEDDGPKLSLTSLLLGMEISEFFNGGHKNFTAGNLLPLYLSFGGSGFQNSCICLHNTLINGDKLKNFENPMLKRCYIVKTNSQQYVFLPTLYH